MKHSARLLSQSLRRARDFGFYLRRPSCLHRDNSPGFSIIRRNSVGIGARKSCTPNPLLVHVPPSQQEREFCGNWCSGIYNAKCSSGSRWPHTRD